MRYELGDVIDSDDAEEPVIDTALVDADGDAWKHYAGGWFFAGQGDEDGELWEYVRSYRPLTVVWVPNE